MPQQYVIHCNSCGLELTPPLEPLQYDSQLSFVDEQPMLPAGYFHPSDGEYFTGINGELLVAPESTANLIQHTDNSRIHGCCGLDGTDGPNQMCANGHEVATLRSDCWHPHVVHFSRHATHKRHYYGDVVSEL